MTSHNIDPQAKKQLRDLQDFLSQQLEHTVEAVAINRPDFCGMVEKQDVTNGWHKLHHAPPQKPRPILNIILNLIIILFSSIFGICAQSIHISVPTGQLSIFDASLAITAIIVILVVYAIKDYVNK